MLGLHRVFLALPNGDVHSPHHSQAINPKALHTTAFLPDTSQQPPSILALSYIGMQKFFNRRQADPSQRNPAPLEGNENSESKQNGIFSKTVRGHLVAMSGEFVGTTMFLFFAFGGTQIANTITPASAPDLQQLLFISLSFGFSLAVTAWVFYRISGGLFNPAVKIAC